MQAGIRTWTTGTKSLRYGLFTMDWRMSWDVRQSVEVQFAGRCDGVVDVGYGCQSGADSANYRGPLAVLGAVGGWLVASVDLSPSLGVGATGYPRHVVIRKADAQAWTPELMSSGRDTWW